MKIYIFGFPPNGVAASRCYPPHDSPCKRDLGMLIEDHVLRQRFL
ncbi:hypothetical protein HMPREF3293_00742 [Christensenella minuta]|uniref:Uncharacterized protein n=1 Tax=Christensenella minuta TaxID=626937 RepID=A0A136Q6N3_9FIRM|nr:hypothetical protein HMPREF3293_00742 [Christensenella minuta]